MLEGSILRQLISDRTQRQQTPLNFGVYYKNTLVALCHALEDCILVADGAPLVITAFQRGKWYLQEADRYGAIAQKARQIAIMATADSGFHSHPTSQKDNVALVDLAPDDPVSQEWHLIIYSPEYAAMVLCQELSAQDYGPAGLPDNDLERKFYGFWTFEPALVRETVELAIGHVSRYDPALGQRLQADLAAIAEHQARPSANGNTGTAVTRVIEYLQGSRQSLIDSQSLSLVEDLDQNLVSNELQAFLRMAQLVELSDPINPLAASEVSSLLEMMGQLLDLPAWRLRRLRLAGMLHRIAPLESETPPADSTPPSCPLVPGAQVLRTMPRLRAVATIITHLSEAWDGSGQPAQLAGDQIPLESRMLGLVSYFQERLAAHRRQGDAAPDGAPEVWLRQALADCQAEKGRRWDPKLMEMLSLMVQGLQQGLSLPALPSRISLSTGLLSPGADGLIEDSGDRPSNLLTT